MSSTRVYESSNGDTWDLVRDEAGHKRVRHTPNSASGGQSSELPLNDFLHSAEHQAIIKYLDARETPRSRGYIHDPKEQGGPYIAVVIDADNVPSVTLHKSYAEAERKLESAMADVKQTTLGAD